MANRTWLQLSQDLRREAGVQGDGPSAVTGQTGIYANLVDWINQAWVDIAGLHDNWKFMWSSGTFTTETATSAYAVPADLKTLEPGSVIATNSGGTQKNLIEVMDYARFQYLYQTKILDADVEPYAMAVRPDKYFVFPEYTSADWVITYKYGKMPTAFTLSTSAPTWPQEYDNVIVFKALIDYGLFYNAPEAVQHGQIRFGDLLARLKDDQLIRPQMRLGRFDGPGKSVVNRFL